LSEQHARGPCFAISSMAAIIFRAMPALRPAVHTGMSQQRSEQNEDVKGHVKSMLSITGTG
jgi:hypothetical protein